MIIRNVKTGHKWEVIEIQNKQIKVRDTKYKKSMLIADDLLSKNWEIA